MPKCSNCHIELEGIKLINHEKYCIQNIKYCDKCKQAIPKDEFEEHLSGHLSRIQSKEIKNEEKKEENNFKKKESTKIECEFCGELLSLDLLEGHEEMCGSRTENCNICGKLIRKRDMENHLKLCSQQNLNQNNYNNNNNNNNNYNNSNYNYNNINYNYNYNNSNYNFNNSNFYYNYSNSNSINFENEYEKYKRQNLMNSTIKNMNEDEQIARAMQDSLKEQSNNNLNNNFQSKNSNNSLLEKNSSFLHQNSDLSYEYQKMLEEQFYEEEIQKNLKEERERNNQQ